MRTAAAHYVSARMRYGSLALYQEAREVLAQVRRSDGDGGLIAVDASGRIAMTFDSQGMIGAVFSSKKPLIAKVFEIEA